MISIRFTTSEVRFFENLKLTRRTFSTMCQFFSDKTVHIRDEDIQKVLNNVYLVLSGVRSRKFNIVHVLANSAVEIIV